MRPDKLDERLVMLLWSTMVVAKVERVETCKRYVVAPAEEFQLTVGLVEMLVVPLPGEISEGAVGTESVVVNLHGVDQPLVPPAFVALTRQ